MGRWLLRRRHVAPALLKTCAPAPPSWTKVCTESGNTPKGVSVRSLRPVGFWAQKGPSSSIVYTWASIEFLYPCFGAYVSTM